MLILGIETSCDDTAVAVSSPDKLLSNIISSQLIHQQFGGIVPELASRAHQKLIVPIVHQALSEANAGIKDIEGIAVTRGPGLMGSLLIGLSFAQGAALAQRIPLIGINHLEAHLWSAQIEHPDLVIPFLSLIVSGGHTLLVAVQGFREYSVIGSTLDDAAGEAYDKVAKLLGLGYPGGPVIDKLSREGDSTYHKFPVPGPRGKTLDFSFSGIKTSVLYFIQSLSPQEIQENLPNICASFQKAVVEAIVEKTIQAAQKYSLHQIVVTGGVAANSYLKLQMQKRGMETKRKVYFPSPIYCTDNGAIVAHIGRKYLSAGITSAPGIAPVANLELGPSDSKK